MTIIFVDQESGSWTDDPRCADLMPEAVAVKKEACYFADNGLVKTDKHLFPDVLDKDPFGLKEKEKENMKPTNTDPLPPVLEPTNAGPMVGNAPAMCEPNTVASLPKRGRPAGATTKAFPAPWDARAKAVGGQTKLATYLGVTYKALREIVNGARECPADVTAKAEFLDKQGAK